MKSDRATEGDILGENRLLWNMSRISFALTHNASSEGNLWRFFLFLFWLWAGYRIWKNRKRTLWSHGCKCRWSFLKPKWAPRDHCPCIVLYITGWEKLLLSQHVWLEAKGIKYFSVTETIDIIHLLWSLPVWSVSWISELIEIWILQSLVDSTQ